MTTRQAAPAGAPCWADLWTSDVEGSRRFYSELFGWEAQAPSPEFGGYFMFTRAGLPVAGGMGDMGDVRANNSWKIYLSVEDAAKTIESADASGAKVLAGADAVAELGTQAVLLDPAGATVGIWQPGSFPGFTVLNEAGTPDWFELLTRDYAQSVEFYRHVFGWEIEVGTATSSATRSSPPAMPSWRGSWTRARSCRRELPRSGRSTGGRTSTRQSPRCARSGAR